MKKDVTLALNYALNKGFQIHPNALKILENIDVKQLQKIIKDVVREKTKKKMYHINQDDLETYLGIKNDDSIESEARILFDPTPKVTTAEGVSGYNSLFASRFGKLKKIIANRPESRMLKTVSAVKSAKSDEDIHICGLVTARTIERNISKIILEDPTGSIETIIFDTDLQKTASTLLNDQFVMLRISMGKNSGFIVKDIVLPDIPDHVSNYSETDAYVVFLSDLHIGSRYFLEEEFSEFISWLSSPDPVARKVRFVVVGGDVIDGVGIYPNQDKELVYKTIEEQLEKAERLLEKIPNNIKVFIMPGNHDPGRRALPQPAIPKKYNSGLWEKDNFFMIGNPAMISLNDVKVLMFHGQSIDDIVKTTPGMEYAHPANVMKHLLKARHLSPIYGSQTPIAPEKEDLMVIDEVPDIFHMGHVHVVELDMYRGVMVLNSGAWQKQTPFQLSVGQVPTPGIAVLVNLKNFKAYTKSFL